MADSPYDPYIARGNPAPEPVDKVAGLKEAVDETKKILYKNVNDLRDRGERLDELGNKTQNLAQSSAQFRQGASQVRKRMWWKDVKMRICIVVGIILLLVVIIVPAVVTSR